MDLLLCLLLGPKIGSVGIRRQLVTRFVHHQMRWSTRYTHRGHSSSPYNGVPVPCALSVETTSLLLLPPGASYLVHPLVLLPCASKLSLWRVQSHRVHLCSWCTVDATSSYLSYPTPKILHVTLLHGAEVRFQSRNLDVPKAVSISLPHKQRDRRCMNMYTGVLL
jgi:hypothetical protein